MAIGAGRQRESSLSRYRTSPAARDFYILNAKVLRLISEAI